MQPWDLTLKCWLGLLLVSPDTNVSPGCVSDVLLFLIVCFSCFLNMYFYFEKTNENAQSVKSGKSVKELLDEMDLGQVSDSSEIENIISQIFEEEKQAVIDAKERPETVNFLVGKVMQKTKGKADPVKTLELIKSKLGQ